MINQSKIINLSLNVRLYCSSSSKSDKIKGLNYTNKELFGSVIKTKKKFENNTQLDTDPVAKDQNSWNSELYWLMRHDKKTAVSAPKVIQNNNNSITSVTKQKTKLKVPAPLLEPKLTKPIESIKMPTTVPMESLKKKLSSDSSKKIKISSTLRKFKESLFPSPVNTSAKVSYTNKCLEIPFSESDLKNMLKYPMISNNKNNCIDGNPIELCEMPSVSKILQATMPEASRKALKKWKLLKIAELGENGFDELQKSM